MYCFKENPKGMTLGRDGRQIQLNINDDEKIMKTKVTQ